MVHLKEIVIEAEDPPQLARFWADTLTEFQIRAYDDEEITRLAATGRTPETDPTVAVDGPGITIFFRETTRPKNERGRIHFDLVGQDRRDEVDRIVALGGSVKTELDGYTVMQDPEGNEFCIQDAEPREIPESELTGRVASPEDFAGEYRRRAGLETPDQ